MARHADIVVPSTTSLERDDIGVHAATTRCWSRCTRAVAPVRACPRRLRRSSPRWRTGSASAAQFTEGRTAQQWLEHLYEQWRERAAAGGPAPDFDAVLAARATCGCATGGRLTLFDRVPRRSRAPPADHPERADRDLLRDVDGFGYDDCPATRRGSSPTEWLGGERAQRFPLHLIANQPTTRLHGQLDDGAHQPGVKVRGREPIRIHPADAAARGIADGDVVRVFNDRGACLAGVVLDDGRPPRRGATVDRRLVRPGRSRRDPDSMCVHGNPNVLTARHRHLPAGARLHRPARAGAGRAVRRRAAADQGVRPAALTCSI